MGVLRSAGHSVIATDLNDYGCPDSEAGIDFLMEWQPRDVDAIVTNPPFKLANKFVAKALSLAPKVVMLLRLAFIEGVTRCDILDSGHLARVYVFRNRLPWMHREGRGIVQVAHNTSAMAFAWFIWNRNHSGPTELHRLSWNKK